jgi:DNA-binding NarL/FixJ family response regulator
MSELVNPNLAPPDRPVNLLLVDDEPVFRTGLRVVIERFPDLQVVAEAESESELREILANGDTSINLVILDLDWGRSLPQEQSGLKLCQELKTLYPQLPILLLSSFQAPVLLEAAQQLGVEGFCLKGMEVSELVNAIRLVVGGERYGYSSFVVREAPTFKTPETNITQKPGLFPGLLDRMRLSGVRQIEAALAEVTEELKDSRLSVLDRAILAGRRRELLTARKLVNKLLAPRVPVTSAPEQPQGNRGVASQPSREERDVKSSAIVRRDVSLSAGRSQIFENTFAKIQYGLKNLTNFPLEIDILREEKRRELLNVVLHKLEDIVDELRFSQVQVSQLPEKKLVILLDLWRSAATDFFGKYYTLQLGNQNFEVVQLILKDAEIIQAEILDKIPQVSDLFSHLLFDTPLIIDNLTYQSGTVEAMVRAELLLQNLVIQVANAVVQPMLNNLADVEEVKQNFYDKRIVATRQIEKFRNDLSWRYRVEKYVNEPTAIFESRYDLLVLDGYGIIKVFIYAPRGYELRELTGIPFAVTLALETRDAIAPRVRSVISLVGRGAVYVLTQVVGRGIGLIARGILQGIGNAWDDTKFGKNSDRGS